MNNSSSNFSLEYREYILPDEFPVLVLAPKNVNRQSSFEDSLTKYHFHNCIEIGICHSGEHNLLFEDSVYKISPGMFFVLSPYTMHFMNRDNTITDDDCEYLYIKPEELLQNFYPFEIPAEMLWYKNSAVPFIFSKETHTVIYDILRQIISEFKEQKDNYKIEYILNEIGCRDITYHSNKEFYSCSNFNGDNKGAINVKNNEYLNVTNWTREKEFSDNSDIITLVFLNKFEYNTT